MQANERLLLTEKTKPRPRTTNKTRRNACHAKQLGFLRTSQKLCVLFCGATELLRQTELQYCWGRCMKAHFIGKLWHIYCQHWLLLHMAIIHKCAYANCIVVWSYFRASILPTTCQQFLILTLCFIHEFLLAFFLLFCSFGIPFWAIAGWHAMCATKFHCGFHIFA